MCILPTYSDSEFSFGNIVLLNTELLLYIEYSINSVEAHFLCRFTEFYETLGNLEHNVLMCILTRNSDSFIFLGISARLNFVFKQKSKDFYVNRKF